MSQNLTQPEEIDRILMFMAGRGITADVPIPDGVPSSGSIRNAGCDESVMGADSSCGALPKSLECRPGIDPAAGLKHGLRPMSNRRVTWD